MYPENSHKSLHYRVLAGLIFLLAAARFGQEPALAHPARLPPVAKSGELVVLTRNAPTSLYINADGEYAGLEYDLATLFARSIGVKVRFVIANRFDQMRDVLERGTAHFAAATGMSVSDDARKQGFKFGPVYSSLQQMVVYNTLKPRPQTIEDLFNKRIAVMAGSSYAVNLRELGKRYPALRWQELPTMESDELMEKVSNGELDYVIADAHIIDVAKNYTPNIDAAFPLSRPRDVAWAFPADADPALLAQVDTFFRRIRKDGTLSRLVDRYFGHVNRLAQIDISTFLEKRLSELPKYRRYFQEAEELTGIDWRVLAALGYQESHWDPMATSAFGVRGLMMLTNDTADHLGVTNRLDARQSILGGARYLLQVKDMLPSRIAEPDRSWIALAAYNTGYGHLEDARVIAQKQKKNPDAWADIRPALMLLRDEAYFMDSKNGYARGGETVNFVENIRIYRDILARFERPYKPVFPSFSEQVTVTNPANLRLGISSAGSGK